MKQSLIIISLLIVTLLCKESNAQIQYSVFTSTGESNHSMVQLRKHATFVDTLNTINHFELGFNIKKPIYRNMMLLETGLSFKKGGALSTSGFGNYTFNSLNIPLNLHYQYASWLSVYGGIVYSYNVKTKETSDLMNVNHHTIGWNGGINIYVLHKFEIGGYYFKSFKNTLEYQNLFGLKPFDYGIKLGYIFN